MLRKYAMRWHQSACCKKSFQLNVIGMRDPEVRAFVSTYGSRQEGG